MDDTQVERMEVDHPEADAESEKASLKDTSISCDAENEKEGDKGSKDLNNDSDHVETGEGNSDTKKKDEAEISEDCEGDKKDESEKDKNCDKEKGDCVGSKDVIENKEDHPGSSNSPNVEASGSMEVGSDDETSMEKDTNKNDVDASNDKDGSNSRVDDGNSASSATSIGDASKENEARESPMECDDSQPSTSKENTGASMIETDKDVSAEKEIDANEKSKDVSPEKEADGDAVEKSKDVSTEKEADEDVDAVEKGKDVSAEKDGDGEVEKAKDVCAEKEVDASKKKDDEGSDIEEIPVEKKPAELVDLEDEEEEKEKAKESEEGQSEKESQKDDGNAENNSIGLKLRSLASLVDTSDKEGKEAPEKDSIPLKSGPVVPNPEAFGAIGEIVEHKDEFFDPESGGLPLRISSVVGGEDCITGLAMMDDDRDSLCAIQISSVTTLIDPISPEDPNKDKDMEDGQDMQLEKGDLESSDESGIKIVSAESLASKEEENEKPQESSGPKIRLSSAVSEVAKDTGNKDASSSSVVFHILRSILSMTRVCLLCCKKVVCDYRVTKKGHHGTFAFICSSNCRSTFSSNLKSDESIERPRLIFEKLCGMCHKDLTSLPRSGQFSWETREFCNEECIVSHLEEVASKCHMCLQAVKQVYIGKYCVRFGSDIHQFCSNHCLERYKTKIKVCCYCQKNVESVSKVVTSPANKEYCSMKCLKRAQRRDIGQQNYNETQTCTVCQTQGSNRYEFIVNGEAQQLCSDPCLNVFKYVNKVKAVTCCLCFRVLNAEDVSQYLYHGGHQLRVFCSDSCVNVFILSARKIVVCDTCKVKKYNFDMIHRQVDEDFKEYYYCSLHCLKIRDIGSGSASDKTSNSTSVTTASSTVASGNIASSASNEAPTAVCSMCNNVAKAQFHMVMSDNTLRSFCRYSCASRYKNTFGFLVDSNSTAKETPPPPTPTQEKNSQISIRAKTTSELTSSTTSTNTSQPSKAPTQGLSQETLQATAELLKMLVPPTVANKTTMCKPSTCTKGVYCKPHPCYKSTNTDLMGIDNNLTGKDMPPILPVPIPCYVPAPMCMYNVPCPVPIFVPIPLPVPIFLPTSAKTSKDVFAMMKKIQEEIPTDPIQAEMLLLARQSMEQDKDEVPSEDNVTEQADEVPSPVDNSASYSGDDEGGNEETVNDELNSADEACLNTMEEDLPRYTLRDTDLASGFDDDSMNDSKGKRKRKSRGRPRKRSRLDSDEDEEQSVSDVDDPDFMPEPETILEEEFQGPFLNKMYGLTAWKSWVTKKNAELAGVSSSRSMKLISEDLLTMNCDELNYALCLFLKDLRKPNGESYMPDTILYLLLGIQQHLFENARTDCIFMDFGFEKFTNSLDEITRTFWVSPTVPGASPFNSLGVTRVTEAMLWECRQLGAHTPQVLLNTLFYFNTKVFRLKTVDDHLAMSFVQIVKQWRRSNMGRDGSGTRTTLLKYYPKKSTTDTEKPRPSYEMHENREDPLRCPVKLYEFYLSKCPESVRNQRNIYYVYPERSCVPDSPVWFSTQAVYASSLSKMLNRALMVREVQEAFAE